jgi:hypothetical protein
VRTPIELAATVQRAIDILTGRCVVCGKGRRLSELPDGRLVHRWPCQGRLLS